MSLILAIDFDGVLHQPSGRHLSDPVPYARTAINSLNSDGHYLIVHTTRAQSPVGASMVTHWLACHDFPQMRVTNQKPDADVFIDDRALHFTSWAQTLEDLNRLA